MTALAAPSNPSSPGGCVDWIHILNLSLPSSFSRTNTSRLRDTLLCATSIISISTTAVLADMATSQAQQHGTVSVQVHDFQIRGFLNSSTGVANLLGIQFATVPARFRQAVPVDLTTNSGIINGTCYGPHCPQPPDAMQGQRSHLLDGVGTEVIGPASEFDCLTLNVYAPPEIKALFKPLPVLVWIHGGGWVSGDGNGNYGQLKPQG